MTDANENNTQWVSAWLESQRDWLNQWQALSTPPTADGLKQPFESLRTQLDPQLLTQQALGMAQSWQQLLQSGGLWPTAFGELDSAPAIGPLREQQLAWQDLWQAQQQYEAATKTLLGIYGEVFVQTLESVQQAVATRQSNGQSFDNLRELHQLWVECGEAVFAQHAHDGQFAAIQARCTNALSVLKQAQGRIIGQWLKAMDLPNRSELNSLHQRVRDLAQRVAELEQRQTPSDNGARS